MHINLPMAVTCLCAIFSNATYSEAKTKDLSYFHQKSALLYALLPQNPPPQLNSCSTPPSSKQTQNIVLHCPHTIPPPHQPSHASLLASWLEYKKDLYHLPTMMGGNLQQLHKLASLCDPAQDYCARQSAGEIVERMKAWKKERNEKLVAGTEQIAFALLGALKKVSLYPPSQRSKERMAEGSHENTTLVKSHIKQVEEENKTLHGIYRTQNERSRTETG